MKSTTIQRLARSGAAPICVFGLLGLLMLAGCGGGGGTGGNPTASPSPSATASVSRVTASLDILSGEAFHIYVRVQWPDPSFVSVNDVVEYHILRNGVIVSAVPKRTTTFLDAGAMPAFSYFAVSANDNTRLNTVTVSAPVAFTSGDTYTYQVTALYVTPESASSATPVYAEAEIGTSETVSF